VDHLVTSKDNYVVPFIDDYSYMVKVSFTKANFRPLMILKSSKSLLRITVNADLLIFGHIEGDYMSSNPFTNLRANEWTKHNQPYTSHSIGVTECMITQLLKQFGKLS
jgi:hypothetical protein